MATKHGINYKIGAFTAGTKDFEDRSALRDSLHPDITIGDAMKIAERLGWDLVLSHVEQTPFPIPAPLKRPWGTDQPIALHTQEMGT